MTREELLEKRTEAFALNTGEGYYDLALCYDGDFIDSEFVNSFKCLYFNLKAGQLGYAEGYNRVATIVELHANVRNNKKRAKEYYKLAYLLGSENGLYNYYLTLKQEKYPTKLKLVVTVIGDNLDIDKFSSVAELKCTEYWKSSSELDIGRNGFEREKFCWQYEFDNLIARDLAPLIDLFKESFGAKVDVISKYIQENDLLMELDVIADINYGIIPSYYMDKEFMSLLVQMNADINFKQEYFEGFVDDYADWLKEESLE